MLKKRILLDFKCNFPKLVLKSSVFISGFFPKEDDDRMLVDESMDVMLVREAEHVGH
jgi:hypothetical protein